MFRELTRKDIIYDFRIEDIKVGEFEIKLPEYERVYNKIDLFLDVKKRGFNLFLVDSYSPEKLQNIVEYIKNKLSDKGKPDDLCMIIRNNNSSPETINLPGGYGKKFAEVLENLQEDIYELVFSYYNELFLDKRDQLIEEIEDKREELLEDLINKAKEQDIEIRYTEDRFAFIPIKDGKAMTEEEYDKLLDDEQNIIVDKIQGFKKKTKEILYKIRDIEDEGIEKGRIIFKEFITKGIELNKDDYLEAVNNDEKIDELIMDILKEMVEELVEVFSNSYSDDEKKLTECIFKYKTKVLVDNSENDSPVVIFEEDPTITNLIGSIDYDNVNGAYVADLENIKAGSLMRANQGVLIIRASSLLKHGNSYHYLKKMILTDKIDMNYNKGYLELLSIGGFKPEPVKVDTKIILIGEDEYFDLLYTYDGEFKETFKIKSESDRVIDIDEEVKRDLVSNLVTICKQEKLKPLTNNAIKEIAKFLSRKAGSRNKIYFDYMDITKLLTITNNNALSLDKHNIDDKDVRAYIYSEELIEKYILESYKNKKILMNCTGNVIGKINGLSVIDLGYHRFGRTLRITCTCYKGSGQIIDVQKESDLSGKVHAKSVNILKGFINQLIGGYNEIPVDFHLSFEQIYGIVEGDSASVAEAICMISALSKIPINQNIAVTGSINQYGEIQPIGGVNEKIEGFFKVCDMVDKSKGKGVLIPSSNREDLVLSSEVEEAILKGHFKIYTMENIYDAIDVLMGSKEQTSENIMDELKKELKKYSNTKKK
ncbi:AAA family ATPase [Oceanirhabdus sp. W0125-5]|uniref:AAA family ATPase n=1 Tax=Oceanirhabdus sp. W0125-5 TaxID=2999116 RepID=UPI0022F2F630|nr:AAA family ATPase [Oceanirhabdus sp. W0125-5]WBW95381.1 AAA family ATPase [Oceanirhabdus sp. W0125-5]